MDKQYKKYLSILIITQIIICVMIELLIVLLSRNIASHNNDILRMVTIKDTEECMREIVDNTIVRIEQKRVTASNEVQNLMDIASELLRNVRQDTAYMDIENILARINKSEYGKPIQLVYEDSLGNVMLFWDGQVTEVTSEFQEHQTLKGEESSITFKQVELEYAQIYLFAMNQDIDKIAKDYIYEEIHNSVYKDNEYIWVNEIVNYEGGEDYAIRAIHPNLRDSEGKYLSTNTEDIQGNLPYLKELKGIKEKGEIVHSYYFKNRIDDKITLKMSYGKLYEPFDWIVATGKPMEDIFMYTDELKEYDTKVVNTAMVVSLNLIMVIFLFGIMIIIKTHRKYKKNIDTYVKTETQLDALTGAYSRKSAEIMLGQEFSKWSNNKGNSPLIMMVDIDNFKRVNDTYGHDVGDLVLKKVSETILSCIRSNDCLFRWGGEEFVILCRQVDLNKHDQLGQKLLRSVNSIAFEINDECFKVSVSIGSSYIDKDDKGYMTTLKRADESLYYSKNTGKNKYSYYWDLPKEICDEL